MDLTEWELDAGGDEPFPPPWATFDAVPPRTRERRADVLARMGRAQLRLRLFRGWSQQDLERSSGVDQTTISRFERGRQSGLSIQRLAAMLEALRVGDVHFNPPQGPPPTALDLMLYGDQWKRALDAADRRLLRPSRVRRPSATDRP